MLLLFEYYWKHQYQMNIIKFECKRIILNSLYFIANAHMLANKVGISQIPNFVYQFNNARSVNSNNKYMLRSSIRQMIDFRNNLQHLKKPLATHTHV